MTWLALLVVVVLVFDLVDRRRTRRRIDLQRRLLGLSIQGPRP